jgi:hypothetical protein
MEENLFDRNLFEINYGDCAMWRRNALRLYVCGHYTLKRKYQRFIWP